ncbi:broad-minded protein-domain-containing protein [Chytridium lagenaria]|nr:broad-minded protein-domain-containing protein [Chytridium lagenaria]
MSRLRTNLDALLNKKGRQLSLSFLSDVYLKLVGAGDVLSRTEKKYGSWSVLNIPSVKSNLKSSQEQKSRFEGLSLALVSRYLQRLFPDQDPQDNKTELDREFTGRTSSLRASKFTTSAAIISITDITDDELHFGFDWFTATSFALFEASTDKVLDFLHNFSKFTSAMFLWTHRSLNLQMIADDRGGIPLIYSCSSHLVEAILGEELPSLFSAFTLSGSQRWMRECFWNHLERPILTAAREGKLIKYLHESGENSIDISTFESIKYVHFMKGLEDKYSETIFEEMQAQIQGLHA